MPGELDDKFKNLKAAYTFMFCHPGKKLLFMGQEFGQLREWSEERELDWFLLGEEKHRDLKDFVQTLLKMYRKYPALYGTDTDPSGFEWINADDGDRSIYSFVRKSPTKRNNLLVVCNFTPVDVRITVLVCRRRNNTHWFWMKTDRLRKRYLRQKSRIVTIVRSPLLIRCSLRGLLCSSIRSCQIPQEQFSQTIFRLL